MKQMLIDDEYKEDNSLVYRDDESNNQPDFYQQIQRLNSQVEKQYYAQQNYYEETVKQLQSQLNRNEEAHKQHMVHLETVGMMSKYQLVFTKMEAAIYRLAGFMKLRDSSSKFIGFNNIRKTARAQKSHLGLKAYTMDRQFTIKASKIFKVLEARVLNLEAAGFKRVLFFVSTKLVEIKQREEQEKQKKLCIQKLTQKDDEIDKAKKKNDEMDSLYWQSKQRETDLLLSLSQKQRQIQKYEQELLDSKKDKPSSTTNKGSNPNNIENKLKDLENSNSVLGLQMQQSQNSISTFVREMNELLDSHSLLMDLQEEVELPQRRNFEVSSFRNG